MNTITPKDLVNVVLDSLLEQDLAALTYDSAGVYEHSKSLVLSPGKNFRVVDTKQTCVDEHVILISRIDVDGADYQDDWERAAYAEFWIKTEWRNDLELGHYEIDQPDFWEKVTEFLEIKS